MVVLGAHVGLENIGRNSWEEFIGKRYGNTLNGCVTIGERDRERKIEIKTERERESGEKWAKE